MAREPAAADLCRRIGLGADLVTPTSSGAYVWVGGELLPIPDRSVLGVPWTADAVTGTGIVSEMGTDTLRRGLARDARPLAGDASVGEVLRPRVGDEAFERLVDPLLGGINAGSADQMSIEACAPPLYEAAARGGPLGPALQEVAARQGQDRGDPGTAAPVFQSVNGGVTRIVKTFGSRLARRELATRCCRKPGRKPRRWSPLEGDHPERHPGHRRGDTGLPRLGVGPAAGAPRP